MKKAPRLSLEHIAPDLLRLARPVAELREDPKNARLHGEEKAIVAHGKKKKWPPAAVRFVLPETFFLDDEAGG